MAREWRDGTTDQIAFLPGALTGLNTGALSWASLIRFTNVHNGGVLDVRAGGSSGTRKFGINEFSSNVFVSYGPDSQHVDYTSLIGVYGILGFSIGFDPAHPTNPRPVRSHLWNPTDGWTHTDLGTLIPSTGAIDWLGMGHFDGAQQARYRKAVEGVWLAELTDEQYESGLQTTLSSWATLQPDALWSFNQGSVAELVVDLTGNGADQDTIDGTIVAADPPGFDYSLGVDATLTVTASAMAASAAVVAGTTAVLSSTMSAMVASMQAASFDRNPPQPVTIYRRSGPVITRRPATLVYRRSS